MDTRNVDYHLLNLTDSILRTADPIMREGLVVIEDPVKRHALRIILNCVDVMRGIKNIDIDEDILTFSKRLGELHLLHNKTLTARQRAHFENWVFKTN